MMAAAHLLKRFAQKEPAAFWAGVFLSLIPVAAGILLLGVAGWFITATALVGGTALALTFDVFRPGAIIRFLALSRTAGRYFERLMTHETTFRYITYLRRVIFRGISALRSEAQGRLRRSLALSRLTTDLESVEALYLRVFLPVLISLSVGAILCLCLAFIHPLIAIITGVFYGGVAFIIPMLAVRLNQKNARWITYATDALRLRISDLEAGAPELAIFNRRPDQQEKTFECSRRLQQKQAAQDRINRRLKALTNLLGQCLVAMTMAVGAILYSGGQITGPVLVALILVSLTVLETVQMSLAGCIDLAKSALSAKRIMPLMKHAHPIGSNRSAKPQKPIPTSSDVGLILEDVHFSYGQTTAPALRDISFTVSPGEKVGIIGPSGCGKSTILQLVSRLLTTTKGDILLAGTPVSQIEETALRSLVAAVSQRTELFNDTVAANLRLAHPEATETELWAGLQHVGLTETIRNREGGLQLMLGENGSGLSGGESRRLVLARTLLTNAALWVMDEPTEGLDHDIAVAVMTHLRKALSDKTVLMAAHRSLELALVDRVLTMENGRITGSVSRCDNKQWRELTDALRPD